MKTLIVICILMISAQSLGDDFDRELMCMANNLYFEDSMHGEYGMQMVAYTVLNRYNDGRHRWPVDICKIVYEPSSNPEMPKKCAFSWTCDGVLSVIELQSKAWEMALRVAEHVLYSWETYDISEGALYYYKCGLDKSQSWMHNIEYIKQVGVHCFYKDKD